MLVNLSPHQQRQVNVYEQPSQPGSSDFRAAVATTVAETVPSLLLTGKNNKRSKVPVGLFFNKILPSNGISRKVEHKHICYLCYIKQHSGY